MFLDLFYGLRDEKIPVSIQEWLSLMDALEKFIYCPFCGENVNDLECLRVLTIRIVADKEYESGD